MTHARAIALRDRIKRASESISQTLQELRKPYYSRTFDRAVEQRELARMIVEQGNGNGAKRTAKGRGANPETRPAASRKANK